MKYISIKETSKKWGISTRRIQILCKEDRIPGAFHVGNSWAIPENAEKPKDARIKSGKYIDARKKAEANKQHISKQRLTEYGEYFTPENVVDEMLMMVEGQLERLDSRFLEPACGTGNFLVPVLNKKLAIAKKKYRNVPFEFEQQSILALSSLYGIELLMENVVICRERLFSIWEKEYRRVCKDAYDEDTVHTANFIVECNIVNGDALTMKTSCGDPIVFSEWAFVKPRLMQRTEYTFRSLSNDLDSEPLIPLKKYVKDYRRIWNNVD